MANLGFFEIDTNGEYVDIATATELTFTEGTRYTLQAINGGASYLTVCTASSEPTEGGFVIQNNQIFSYTPVADINCYLKTNGGGKVYLNIAD